MVGRGAEHPLARGTYESTHDRIVASARKMFMQDGFERTNLRDLCADAGITTGSLYRHFATKEDLFTSLVQPAIDELRRAFSDAEPLCRQAVQSGDISGLWRIVDADRFLDYLYRNMDALKLLLKGSDGTKHSEFLHEVVTLEADITLRSLRAAKERGLFPGKLPSQPEMHMLCHAYISCLFEAVLHDFSREDMEQYIRTIMSFFAAGTNRLLGLT